MTTTGFAIRDLGDDAELDHPFYPALSGDAQPVLLPGETVLWSGDSWRLSLETKVPGGAGFAEQWRFTDQCRAYVTDQRLIYVCKKFTSGNVHGSIINPLNFTLTYQATSALRAKARRHGKAVVGAISYRWTSAVILQVQTTKFGKGSEQIGLRCIESDNAVFRVWIGVTRGTGSEVAPLIVRSAAAFQLATGGAEARLGEEENLEKLHVQKENPVAAVQVVQKTDRREFRSYALYGAERLPSS